MEITWVRASPRYHRALVSRSVPTHDVRIVPKAQLLVEMDGGPALRIGEQIKRIGSRRFGPLNGRGKEEFSGFHAPGRFAYAHLGELVASRTGYVVCTHSAYKTTAETTTPWRKS